MRSILEQAAQTTVHSVDFTDPSSAYPGHWIAIIKSNRMQLLNGGRWFGPTKALSATPATWAYYR